MSKCASLLLLTPIRNKTLRFRQACGWFDCMNNLCASLKCFTRIVMDKLSLNRFMFRSDVKIYPSALGWFRNIDYAVNLICIFFSLWKFDYKNVYIKWIDFIIISFIKNLFSPYLRPNKIWTKFKKTFHVKIIISNARKSALRSTNILKLDRLYAQQSGAIQKFKGKNAKKLGYDANPILQGKSPGKFPHLGKSRALSVPSLMNMVWYIYLRTGSPRTVDLSPSR